MTDQAGLFLDHSCLPSNIHKFNFQSALLLLVWVLLNEIASSYYISRACECGYELIFKFNNMACT